MKEKVAVLTDTNSGIMGEEAEKKRNLCNADAGDH